MKYRFQIVVAVLVIAGGVAAYLFWQQIRPVQVPEPVPQQALPVAPPPAAPEVRNEIEAPPGLPGPASPARAGG